MLRAISPLCLRSVSSRPLLWLALLSSALPVLAACSSDEPRAAEGPELASAAGAAGESAPPDPEWTPGAATPGCDRASCLAPELGGLDPRDPARQRRDVRGTTAGPSASASASCPGLGPELSYALDLRAFREPAKLELGLHADFNGS